MNILHLIESLNIGGAQIRLINDLKFMDRKRFNNIVCSLNGDGKLLKEITNLGIKAYTLNGIFNIGSIFRLFKIIKQNHIDVIHTQLFFADLYGRLLGKLLRMPFIVTTIQSSVYEPDNNYLYSFKRKLLDKYSGRLCNNRFIAVSEFVKMSINKRLKIGLDKIEVIPNYVDFDQLNRVNEQSLIALKKELSINPGEIVFITVSRLNPAKGLTYLLKAFSNLSSKYKTIKLLIVGDGPSREELERLSHVYGISDKVMFLGEREDVRELIYISDIFVFPTLSEGMPLSLLEAMAIGKPCIASNIGPVREIIKDGDNGVLFRPKDSNDIERAMLEFIGDMKKANQMGLRGQDFIKRNFDPIRNAKLLEELYLNLGKHSGGLKSIV